MDAYEQETQTIIAELHRKIEEAEETSRLYSSKEDKKPQPVEDR